MPISQKNNLKQNKSSLTKSTKKNYKTNQDTAPKKVTIKRRTSDLVLSKASATAIASQANHAREKAFESKAIYNKKSSNKIPLRVWIFFWFSLLLFCISFYRAAIRPQLEVDIYPQHENNEWIIGESTVRESDTYEDNDGLLNEFNSANTANSNDTVSINSVTDVIQAFFYYLSNRDFNNSFNLLIPALQRSSEIREHFTAFRIIPFLEWIEWWVLSPSNFQYISTSTYWRDRYSFDLSYTLSSTKETFNESWEFVVDTKWESPKITSIVCTTPKCSYHPIFRPENFGMMR